ncbi:hypothetical protein [Kordia jejudonensis]|uniref:hypothetical protein n=1 Tax=Kordia jejudonensis TaxID=1348245 RepID=UPI0006293B05|nr:hypothetical protein [Kordia jejudonensis]
MKRERKLKLAIKKVSISKLNTIFGAGGDPVPSVDLPCELTTIVITTIIGVDCKTGATKTNDSLGNCIGIGSREC